jgi:hypothetical protein
MFGIPTFRKESHPERAKDKKGLVISRLLLMDDDDPKKVLKKM